MEPPIPHRVPSIAAYSTMVQAWISNSTVPGTEIRDFYSGAPDYNQAAFRGGQHNVVAAGGVLLKFK